jgi:hypothetical protein
MLSHSAKAAFLGLSLALSCTSCVVVPASSVATEPPPPHPTAPPAREAGGYCREYQQTVIIGGQAQQAFGTTCQQADGTWRMTDQAAPPARGATVTPIPPPVSARPARYAAPLFYIPVGPATTEGDDHAK